MTRRILPGLLALLLSTTLALADRPFAFVNDAYPTSVGEVEFAQWLTWSYRANNDSNYNNYQFVHEIETGLTEKSDLHLYLAIWDYEDSDAGSRTRYDSSEVEYYHYFTNPVTDTIGIAASLEVRFGPEFLEVGPALILQKDVGKWTFAYNLGLETEWEGIFSGDQNDTEGEIVNAIGVSYSLAPGFRVGGEFFTESVLENWTDHEDTSAYIGPNIQLGGELGQHADWNLVFAPMFQLTDVDDEPDFLFRLIAEIEF